MAIDRKKARAAGYTDQEIDAYEAAQAQQEPMGNEPPPPPPADADQGQTSGPGFVEMATTAAMAAAPYALPAVGLGAAGYGAMKIGGWGRNLAQSASDVASAMRERTNVEAAREARMANRPGFGGTPRPTPGMPATPGPVAPAAPAAAPVLRPTPGMPATPGPVAPAAPVPTPAAPVPTPAAPVPTPAAAAQSTAMQRGLQYADTVRQLAMEKVMQTAQRTASMARAAAPAAVGLGGLMYSGGLNTNEQEELRRRQMMPPTITGQ
jgi:hypothetical protein